MTLQEPEIFTAIRNLRPKAQYVCRGESIYSNIEWLDATQSMPTEAEIEAEINRYRAAEYQRKRAAEYPPMADYLDAVVKGDQAQMQAYVDACLAVKAKYPKE
jgi:hypothetical protein